MDFARPAVADHLKHLPASCGKCGQDHRLAIVLDSTETTEKEYGEVMVRVLQISVDPTATNSDREAGAYWQALYEAELRHRYLDQPTPAQAEQVEAEILDLLSKLGMQIIDFNSDED